MPGLEAGMIGRAMAQNATTTQALVELNGKLFELVRAQGDAAFSLWRSTLSAGSLSEAVRIQTSGVREAYETSAERWKDIAETAARLMRNAAPAKPGGNDEKK